MKKKTAAIVAGIAALTVSTAAFAAEYTTGKPKENEPETTPVTVGKDAPDAAPRINNHEVTVPQLVTPIPPDTAPIGAKDASAPVKEEPANIEKASIFTTNVPADTKEIRMVIDERKVTVLVNGEELHFDDAEPLIINDYTMLPFRKIAEAIGAEVYYQQCPNDIGLITTMRDHTLVVMINAEYFAVDTIVGGAWRLHRYDLSDDPKEYVSIFFEDSKGEYVMNPQPIMMNDRILVPVRTFSEAFGATVGWDEETYTVTIDIPAAQHVRTPEQIEADTNYTYQDAMKYCREMLESYGAKPEEADAIMSMVDNQYNINGKLYGFSVAKFSEYKWLAFYADGTPIGFN